VQANEPVTVEYTLSSQEVMALVRWQLIRNPRIRYTMPIGIVLMIGGGVIVLLSGRSPIVGVFIFAIGVTYAVLWGFLLYRVPRKAAKKAQAQAQPRQIEFSEAGVHTRGPLSEATTKWAAYSEVFERDGMYVIKVRSRKVFIPVPKRAFRSPEDELLFRSLVQEHAGFD
jgi:hypothetical protein